MNRGLFEKALREVWLGTLLFGTALFVIEWIFATVLPGYLGQFADQLTRISVFRNVLTALLGTDIGERLHPLAFISIAWVHPVPLALLWAHEIIHCTRTPVGEIDRGTIDVLLSLPVSRWQLFVTESAIWVLTGLLLIGLAVCGHALGSIGLEPDRRAEGADLLRVAANLFCLYLAVGGLAYLLSAISDRRGRAIGAVFALVLGSFFLGFLAQFWTPAEAVSFLGLLDYYRPFEVFNTHALPWADLGVLASIGLVAWVTAGITFARRDICTV